MENPSESEYEGDEFVSSDGSGDEATTGDDAEVDDGDINDGDRIGGDNGLFAHDVATGAAEEIFARLLIYQCCKRAYLDGKKQALDDLMGSLPRMTKHERRCAMVSGLALCEVFSMDPKATAKGDVRQRKRFGYMLLYVGKVCKEAYTACFDISHRHLVQSCKQVELGDISVRLHGNLKNKHAAVHGQDTIAQWFCGVASEVGETVPLRVRLKKKTGDQVVRYYGYKDNTLLRAPFT